MFPDISSVLSAFGGNEAKQQTQQQVQIAALADPANQAILIREAFASSILASIASGHLGSFATAEGFKVFCDQYLAASGNPTDPAEVMLCQQLLWSHHRIGQLLVASAAATSPELVEAYGTAAVKLMAEHRRSTMALREYRAPVSARQVTLVKNVAAGNQQVAVMQGDSAASRPGKKPDPTQLVSNDGVLAHDKQPTAHPQADRGTSQPREASGRNARRAATAA
jgi:hypothetical protein